MTADEIAKLRASFVGCGLDTKKLEAHLFAQVVPSETPPVAEIVDVADARYQAIVLLRQVKGHLAKTIGLLDLMHPD